MLTAGRGPRSRTGAPAPLGGGNDEVRRLLPPLNIEEEHLELGLQTITDAVRSL